MAETADASDQWSAERLWKDRVASQRSEPGATEAAEGLGTFPDRHGVPPAKELARVALESGPLGACAKLVSRLVRRGYAKEVADAARGREGEAREAIRELDDCVARRKLALAFPEALAQELPAHLAAKIASCPPQGSNLGTRVAWSLPPGRAMEQAAMGAAKELAKEEAVFELAFARGSFVYVASKRLEEPPQELIEHLLESVNRRLSSPDERHFSLGKALANAAARLIHPDGEQPFGGDDGAVRIERAYDGDLETLWRTAAVHEDGGGAKSGSADVHWPEQVDESETDSLPAYELDEEEEEEEEEEDDHHHHDVNGHKEAEEGPEPPSLKPEPDGFVWLGEVMEGLSKADDPDAVEHALKKGREVIESSGSEADELAPKLVSTLVRARPNTPDEEARGRDRLGCLAAIAARAPLSAGEPIAESALGHDNGLDLSQRIECLCAIPPACLALSKCTLPSSPSSSSSSSSHLLNTLPQSGVAHLPPTERLGRVVRASEKALDKWRNGSTSGGPNALAHVAFDTFVRPVCSKLMRAKPGENPAIDEAGVLTRALTALAAVHCLSGASPGRRDMAVVTLELMESDHVGRRAQEDISVRRAFWQLGVEVAAGLDRSHVESMLAERSRAPELLRWLRCEAKAASRDDPDSRTRELAKLAMSGIESSAGGSLTDASLLLCGQGPNDVPESVPPSLRILV